jgi:flavodoxin I
MKTLIIYDSLYGNTEKIAHAIGDAFAGETNVIDVNKINNSDLGNTDLLIVGSPTHGGRPTKAVQKFLNNIPADSLKNMGVAAFDTRMSMFIAKLFGYAANRMVEILKSKGGRLVASPQGFIVTGKEGPLRDGELELAKKWAREVNESKG